MDLLSLRREGQCLPADLTGVAAQQQDVCWNRIQQVKPPCTRLLENNLVGL